MRLPAFFAVEEKQYAPFVAGAIFFGLVLGVPLGITLAIAGAEKSSLDGHWPALVQAHGHIQLMGWFGLFVLGMGYRLVPRFTGTRLRTTWPVPVTFALVACGLLLRVISQPWMDREPFGALAVGSAMAELGGALIFATIILRCLTRGRPEDFGYTPYFAAGAAWLVVAASLNLTYVADTAGQSVTLPPARSTAITFVLLYGFVMMFVLAVSLRSFPVFFGRPPVSKAISRAAWLVINGGVAMYVCGAIWRSYEISDTARLLYDAGVLASGLGLVTVVLALGILRGAPTRLRLSARRSMLFVRTGYAWLLAAGALQGYYAGRALADDRLVPYYETDAVRHFLALGFVATTIFGMALLVLPRLAIRRGTGRSVQAVVVALLVLIQGAAAARGVGSVLANDTHLIAGFWTMAAGGIAALLAMLVFTAYLVRDPGKLEIPLSVQPGASTE